MWLSTITLPAVAFAAIALSGTGAQSAEWHGCTHSTWKDTFGYSHFLVADSLLQDLGQGAGVQCTDFSDDYITARAQACSASMTTGEPWAEFKSVEQGLNPLRC